MGLYDGRQGTDGEGSTAEVAQLLNVPVVLVVDVSRQSQSAAATVLGFQQLKPAVRLIGVILNRVGSDTHQVTVTQAIEAATGLPVLGTVRRDTDLVTPERYLGLVPRYERNQGDNFFSRATSAIRTSVDVDRLLRLCAVCMIDESQDPKPVPSSPAPSRARLAVARDRAFGFYYADALDLLEAHGLELVEFSPLADRALPQDTDGVYLGGGFPELFAADLGANEPLLHQIRDCGRRGMPVYAECGGLMYLARTLVDASGARHRLAGLVPAEVSLENARLTLGYRDGLAASDSLLLRRGERLRGHEFHYSWLRPAGAPSPAYTLRAREPAAEGHASGSVLASYVHLHFAGAPALAARFADACASWRARRAA